MIMFPFVTLASQRQFYPPISVDSHEFLGTPVISKLGQRIIFMVFDSVTFLQTMTMKKTPIPKKILKKKENKHILMM